MNRKYGLRFGGDVRHRTAERVYTLKVVAAGDQGKAALGPR